MPRPIIHDGETQREMTAAEHESYKELQQQLAAQAAAADAKAAALAAARTKLSALGLTDDEIAALFGE